MKQALNPATTPHWLRWPVYGLMIYVPAAATVIDKAPARGLTVLALFGMLSLYLPARRRLDRSEKALLGIAVWCVAVAVVSYFVNGMPEQSTNSLGSIYAKYLLALPFVLLLLRVETPAGLLWWGVCLGAVLSGAQALYDTNVLELLRAKGATEINRFGHMSMMLSLLSIASFGYFNSLRSKAFLLVPLSATCLGLAASILAGSRGALVALLPALIVLYWYHRRTLRRRALVAAMTVIVLAGVLPTLSGSTILTQRAQTIVAEVDAYVRGDSAPSSIGYRLDMWKQAVALFLQRPLLGHGPAGFRMARSGDQEQPGFISAHSEYFETLSTRGALGFIGLVALFGYPSLLFYRHAKRPEPDCRRLGLAGLLLTVSFAVFSLTLTIFLRSTTVCLYLFLTFFINHLALETASGANRDAPRTDDSG